VQCAGTVHVCHRMAVFTHIHMEILWFHMLHERREADSDKVDGS